MKNSILPSKMHWFGAVDGLRIIASLNILLYHMISFGAFSDFKNTIAGKTFLSGAAFHSSFFFILAGFIFFTKSLTKEMPRKQLLKSRFRRLYPLFVSTLIASFFIINFNKAITTEKVFGLLKQVFMIWPLTPWLKSPLNEPSWVISAFFLCFLIFPELQKLVNKRSCRGLFTLFVISFSIIFLWSIMATSMSKTSNELRFFHVFPPIRVMEFILGMIVAKLWSKYDIHQIIKTKLKMSSGTAFCLIMILILLSNLFSDYFSLKVRWTHHHAILPIFYLALVLITTNNQSRLNRFLGNKFFKSLSPDSFAVFLIHIPLLILLKKISVHLGYGPKPLNSSLLVFIFVIAIYGLSWVVRNIYRKFNPKKQALLLH